MLKQINNSFIALITKEPNPSTLNQFQPISLCNVLYKIISKILAIASSNNYFGSRDCSFNGTQKGKEWWIGLKLDMEKAYNKLEWPFILQVLRCFGFSSRWVQWIEQCISMVSFSIVLNGCLFDHFKPQQSLRQEDPLSPFLFILVAKVLWRSL